MKSINSPAFGLCEISESDAKAISGGITWGGAFVAYVLISALTNPQKHIDAFLQGYNEGYQALKTSQQ